MLNFEIRLATLKDLPAMIKVGDKVFDHPIKPDRAKEFLTDPRHHLVLAYLGENIIGIASALHYVHPDKDPALFMNEVGVVEQYRNQGVAKAMVRHLHEYAKAIGCKEAWVATEHSNIAARRAYVAAGGVEDKEPVVLINFDAADNKQRSRPLSLLIL